MGNEEKKQILIDRTFKSMLNILVIFAVPAFVVLFLGSFLQKKGIVHFNITWYLLPISFVFSWILVIRLYRKISLEFKKLEENKSK